MPYDINLNMADPAFRYEQKAALNTQVANPFRNYLTPDKFPGQLRNTATVTLGSLLVPYPQYGAITQTNTNGRNLKDADAGTARAASVHQRLQLPGRLRLRQREARRSGSTTSPPTRCCRPTARRAGNGGR